MSKHGSAQDSTWHPDLLPMQMGKDWQGMWMRENNLCFWVGGLWIIFSLKFLLYDIHAINSNQLKKKVTFKISYKSALVLI